MSTPPPDAAESTGPESTDPGPAPSHRAPRPVPGAVPDAAETATTPQATEASEAMTVTETPSSTDTETTRTDTPTVAIPTAETAASSATADTVAIPVAPAPAAEDATVAIPLAAPASSLPAAPAPSVPVPTTPVAPVTPLAPAAAVAGAAAATPDAAPQWSAPPEQAPAEAEIFPESMGEEPSSRAGAHWWGVLIAFTLTPIAWFLLVDGSARIFWSMLADPANVNVAGYISLGVGLTVLAVALLAARWSSVGPAIVGSLSALIGLTFLVFPVQTLDFLAQYQDRVEAFGGFGTNLYAYTVESGMRGTFLMGGVVLIMAGVVSHGARRKGRREERVKLAVRAAKGENPFA